MRNASKDTSVAKGMDLTDEATVCCHRIETLAELLAAGAQAETGEWVEPAVAARAGWMISQEARKLHTLIEGVRKMLVV